MVLRRFDTQSFRLMTLKLDRNRFVRSVNNIGAAYVTLIIERKNDFQR